MIALELHSPEPPDVVLAALRARAGAWRESEILPELWSAGIYAIECETHGPICELHYERRWYYAGAAGQFLHARALTEPEAGGTRVQVVVECRLRHVTLFALGNGFATFMGVVAFGPVALLYAAFPLSVMVIGYLWMRVNTRGLTRCDDPEADYLVRRIETVVAEAGSTPLSAQVG
jgi:hypothetical protein